MVLKKLTDREKRQLERDKRIERRQATARKLRASKLPQRREIKRRNQRPELLPLNLPK